MPSGYGHKGPDRLVYEYLLLERNGSDPILLESFSMNRSTHRRITPCISSSLSAAHLYKNTS